MQRQIVVLSSVVGLTACASYAARTVPIRPLDTYVHQATVSSFTVAADVYDSEEKYKAVFDTTPSYERGYLPVNLLFFNDSPDAVLVDPAAITVTTTGGIVLQPIPATQVGEQVLRSTTGRYFLGGVLAAGSSKGANDRIRADFAAKGLAPHSVAPGGRSQGFVFFANTALLRTLTVNGLRTADGAALEPVEIAMPEVPLYTEGT